MSQLPRDAKSPQPNILAWSLDTVQEEERNHPNVTIPDMLSDADPEYNLPQASTETFGKILEELFEEILNTLRNFDHFGRLHSPSIFLVYAHDKPNAGNAHVSCVHHLIKWLQKVGAQILSDRSPLLEVSNRQNGGEAVRDILANQICLLPPVHGSAGDKEVISSVDKVLLCGSDVLREYCKGGLDSGYIDAVERLCTEEYNRGIYPENLQGRIRQVMNEFQKRGEVHHVHTELAFLRVRYQRANTNGHGIIPVALNGDLMDYVQLFENSNLVLKLKSTTKLLDLHKLFFKVLRQLFTDHLQDIDEFENCYDAAYDRFSSSTNDRAEPGIMIKTAIRNAVERCKNRVIANRREWDRREESKTRNRTGQCVSAIAFSLMLILLPGNDSLLEDAIRQSLSSLRATDPELDMTRIEHSKDALLKNCYEWILNDSVLQEWRDGDTSPLLWIQGEPGKGKTMLMIALARELVKNPPRRPCTVTYFFCQETDPRLNTASSILRGLIWSLAMKDAQLAHTFHTMYQSKSNQLDGSNAIFALFSTLAAMLEGCPGAFILIDALDECSSGTEREQLLHLIVTHAKSSKTKWLLSSRNDADIKQVLIHDGRMLSLELNEEHISRAVTAFIEEKTNELAKKNTYSLELKEMVKKDLVAKSDSTFLWVALACKRLLKVPAWKAPSTLQDLPPGLPELYSRMLDQVFQTQVEEGRHYCVAILRSVTLTFRPLSMEELITTAGLPSELQASDLLHLIELCGSFVTVRRGIIYFIHQSAKDYLVTGGAPKLFSTCVQKEHGLLVRRSLDSMLKTLRKDMCNLRHPGAPAHSASINTHLRSISYVCSFWIDHLVKYLDDDLIDDPIYQEYFSDQGRVHRFLLEHLLHWFEALSLIGEVDRGINGLYSLERMIQQKLTKSSVPDPPRSIKGFIQIVKRERTRPSSSETALNHNSFVHDAIRVFRQCRTAVEEAPLQVYCSALIFSPEESLVRQTFKQEIPQWISSLPRILYNWNPCLQTLEGHENWVNSVVFSPDGRQLASGSHDRTGLSRWSTDWIRSIDHLDIDFYRVGAPGHMVHGLDPMAVRQGEHRGRVKKSLHLLVVRSFPGDIIGQMTPPAPGSLATTLQTSIVLCERFASSLAPNASVELPPTNPASPSPLVLLNAAVTALRSQVTKLSLLAITTPFTPSAVTTCLLPLNESILTSLVTAALLTTPEQFSPSFSSECRSLVAAALRDMPTLLRLVEIRSQAEEPQSAVLESEKKAFTEATGRVWDDCDKLTPLANEGVPGYVVRQSKQWLELMKDAVKELEEWDPEEVVDDEDLFGDALSDDDTEHESNEKTEPNDRAAISAGVKEQALKVLNRIPQSIHVVIKQRLEKMDAAAQTSSSHHAQLDTLLKRNRHISELIDESAEGMYLGDLELCLKKAGEARALTIEVVESVMQPMSPTNSAAEAKENKYVKRALEWIQQVDPGGYERTATSKTTATGGDS
ncbi:uncharacterized protein Z518_08743 [Rhinocladiella mackenziei CBS 650.93]|uniref:NACHT domain-containing protein n=1 Tax=Rhinocladiella mackenziei CBS 650.93 TaxID=1442369 RepID=A0A0D2J1M1_9EURO|nr:uncharacterized protein Z518_08743 [Rhinocladiella mackenziei CBS 650.93]KIX02800.1 hypothetical protein Z518_08743 [Rhinocladiella mackenziei CBS 650.93]